MLTRACPSSQQHLDALRQARVAGIPQRRCLLRPRSRVKLRPSPRHHQRLHHCKRIVLLCLKAAIHMLSSDATLSCLIGVQMWRAVASRMEEWQCEAAPGSGRAAGPRWPGRSGPAPPPRSPTLLARAAGRPARRLPPPPQIAGAAARPLQCRGGRRPSGARGHSSGRGRAALSPTACRRRNRMPARTNRARTRARPLDQLACAPPPPPQLSRHNPAAC